MTTKARYHTLLLCFACTALAGFTQPTPYNQRFIDSVTAALSRAPDDTAKVEGLRLMASMYLPVNPALTIKYGSEGAALAEKINDPDGLIMCLGQTAFCYSITGEWAKAIRDVNRAIPLAERYQPQRLFYFYIIRSNLADFRGNYEESLQWALKARNNPFFSTQPEVEQWPIYFVMARGYGRLNRLDSASLLIKKVLQLADKHVDFSADLANGCYMFAGDLAAKKGAFSEALRYYRRASYAGGIASIYHRLHQSDSATYYALQELQEGWVRKLPTLVQESSLILAQEYEQKNPVEANKYLNIYIASKDSLYNSEKLRQVEEIQLGEQQNLFVIERRRAEDRNRFIQLALVAGLTVAIAFSLLVWRNSRFRKKANQKLEEAYNDLKSTQQQLIQSEKMASLGELTAGIAHEIQNPLNFVNNFSEVNREMIDEATGEIDKGNFGEIKNILIDIKENSEKITHHGKRADAIVKGMLQHSRKSEGLKEPADINALCDEYLRLAYHGMKAKDKAFNAEIKTDFDTSVGRINIVPQEMGRVLLNLFNNAFYALNEKQKLAANGYQPTAKISTRKLNDKIEIKVEDNGNGIPENIIDKIFQPFFTTKPTGQGTGLGLSLSYDIIKAHNGEIKVETKEGEGVTFVIVLPAE